MLILALLPVQIAAGDTVTVFPIEVGFSETVTLNEQVELLPDASAAE